MGVWVYGCMGVWVYGCMGVWVYGCMGVWVYELVGWDTRGIPVASTVCHAWVMQDFAHRP